LPTFEAAQNVRFCADTDGGEFSLGKNRRRNLIRSEELVDELRIVVYGVSGAVYVGFVIGHTSYT
jgi:hypothetical protein